MSWAKIINYYNNYIHGCQFFEKFLMERPWKNKITPCKIKKMQFFLVFPLCAHNFDEFQSTPKSTRHTKYFIKYI
jgi:hypothetical protein